MSVVATEDGLDTLAASVGDDPALAPGEQLGRFKIERQLGIGGMGQVFAARDMTSGEVVALKYLERSSASLLYRFKNEFRALADVNHENLVSLGELIVLPDQVTFFTMELIDGVPFDEYVRGKTPEGQLPNISRLKRALRQLVAGVRHLHTRDCIHRDLKPSNVLVTAEGRVVILDFGLVQDHSEAQPDDPEDQIMGTPAYMSPEQAGLEHTGPPADYYAVGVMLYECLTGKRPFRGSLTHLLFAKREFDAPEVSELVDEVPEDLAFLCRRLLSRDPDKRPGGREVMAILSSGSAAIGASMIGPAASMSAAIGATASISGDAFIDPGSSMTGSTISSRTPFIGRKRELAALDDAWSTLRGGKLHDGSPVTVHVRGRSGYGKSALVREFLSSLRDQTPAVVLRGRCLERESVPYKGVDSVVDSLSVRLHRMLEDEREELRPRHLGALIQIFPILSDVWPLRESVPTRFEPSELRRLGLAGLRDLFERIAKTHPLVIHIDDFQWADVDGARLLASLVRPPDPPAMLLLVSFRELGRREPRHDSSRDASPERPDALRELTSAEAQLGRDVRELELGPLADIEARELAWQLMGGEDHGTIGEREAQRRRADALARGARGNPFYIGQMVLDDGIDVSETGDDRIVARRIVQLSPDARRLLATVAVSGGPTPLAVVREVYEHNQHRPDSSFSGRELTAVGEV
ncbi:MAG: protein kinase, partial [Myxococcales bacterium]|nr:protein kinase [Myxococcales bacterium]